MGLPKLQVSVLSAIITKQTDSLCFFQVGLPRTEGKLSSISLAICI